MQRILGPLGWGALLVFALERCKDVANLAYKLVLGRSLDAVDFGAVDPVFGVLALMALPMLIVTQVAVKYISRLRSQDRYSECRELIRHLCIISVVGSFAAIGLVVALQRFILSRLHLESTTYIWLIGGLLVLSWWRPLTTALLQGFLRYRVMLFSAPLNAVLIIVFVALFVVLLGWGLPGALLARIMSAAVPLGVVFFLMRRSLTGERQTYRKELRPILAMVLPMSVYMGSLTLLFQFDRLFVRNFMLAQSGGFGAVVTYGSIPAYLIGPIVFVLFPLAAAEHARGRDISRLYRQALIAGIGVTVFGVGASALVAKPLMRFLKPSYVDYAGHLWVYTLAMGMHGTIQIIASVEMARHRYGFLWFVAVPVLLMCGLLYAGRGRWSLSQVVWIVAGARMVILAGAWSYGVFSERRSRGDES